MTIKSKILVPAVVFIVLGTAALLLSTIMLFSDFVDDSTFDRVRLASKVAHDHLDELAARANSVSVSMAENEAINVAIMDNDRDELLAIAREMQEKVVIDFCMITDTKGTVIMRIHAPENYGDFAMSPATVQAVMRGESITSLEEGPVALMAVRSSTPVFDARNIIVGIVSVGYRLDTEDLVDSVKEVSGCEASIFLRDERISTTITRPDGARARGTKPNTSISAEVLAGMPYIGQADIMGRAAVASYMPINGPDGKTLGMLGVGQYVDETVEAIWAFARRGVMSALGVLAVFIVVILFIVRHIISPIHAMTEAASALVSGDTDIEIKVRTKDEIRILADAFNSMVENTRQQVCVVEHIAAGDLTIPVELRSEKDVMNRALKDLRETIRTQAAEIQEGHERIQLLLDATPLASRLWDRNLDLVECNEAAVKLFGLKNKQEYMDRYFELSPEYQPDGKTTRDKLTEVVTEAFEKGESYFKWMYQTFDGTSIPTENILVRVPYGNDYVVAAYSRDLREQNKMLAEIEHRDNLLNMANRMSAILFSTAENESIENVLVESMKLMGLSVNVDRVHMLQSVITDGERNFICKYTWANDLGNGAIRVTAGMKLPPIISPDLEKDFLQGLCLNSPVPALPPALRQFYTSVETKSILVVPVFVQEQFWGLVSFSDCKQERSFQQDEVSILRSVSLLMAIAVNRNEQTVRIHEAHNRNRLLINATPLAFNMFDRNLNNIETNETAVELFGLNSQQEYLDRFFELSPEHQNDGRPSKEKMMELLKEAFSEGCSRFEWLHQKFDGTQIPVEVRLVRLRYGDDYVVAGYTRDMRAQKKMIAEIQDSSAKLKIALSMAEEADKAKSAFLAHMSHEIRTPLNAVIGLSELTMGDSSLSREAESNLGKVYSAGATILSIVNDILDISKIESGKFEIHPVQYDTPSLINDTVMLNIIRIKENPIIFKLFVDENLPGTLYGDDIRVKQIFNNLLSNAFKYTNFGTVEWHVSSERDGDDVWIISSVKDTGLGIKPEDIPNLFADYRQMDTKVNRKIEGTGLGLAITRSLTEMMGGNISVESEYGKGSVFTVRLRQALVSESPIGKEVAAGLMGLQYTLSRRAKGTQEARVNLSYARVLVVDDIVTNLDVVKGMMKPYQVNIDCATSGPQAIEMVRAGEPRYNAVFMDHMMPGMDGIEAARIIREEIGTDYARNIPIIALTANAIAGNKEMFLSAGFQDFISKPIDLIKLDSVLRHWVRDKNREEDIPAPVTGNINTESGVSVLSDVTINGLDMEKALERFGGNEEVLIDVLRSYVTNTRPLLQALRENIDTNNFGDYAITVHGIKGSSYGIFAQEAGKAAETLEMAAKAGYFEAVKAGHDAFEKIEKVLLGDIARALGNIDAITGKTAPASAPDPELFTKLREACATFDMDGVDAVMAQLESFRYERGGQTVAWLRDQVNQMAFEKISQGAWPEEKNGTASGFTAPEAEILIVEDNETNRKAALGLLKSLQMHMDTAENGQEALDKIRKKHYHLIFMDHMMPVMDGIEAVQNLRRMEGEYYQKVPVIALTANDTDGSGEQFLQAGMNDFAAKPINMKEIRQKIRQWLPAELIHETSPAAAQAELNVSGAEQEADVPVINGINTDEGIRYSGTRELFISLLGDFYKLIDLKAAKIEQCLADGLIRDLTIEVHALKTTSRMIGAGELSQDFARLEQYGSAENREALERETPAVLEKYRSYKPALRPFGEMPEQEKKAASAKELTALLRELKSATDNFDLDGTDAALKQLESLQIPEECRTQMETLRAYVADVSMENIMKLADEMISIIETIPEDALWRK